MPGAIRCPMRRRPRTGCTCAIASRTLSGVSPPARMTRRARAISAARVPVDRRARCRRASPDRARRAAPARRRCPARSPSSRSTARCTARTIGIVDAARQRPAPRRGSAPSECPPPRPPSTSSARRIDEHADRRHALAAAPATMRRTVVERRRARAVRPQHEADASTRRARRQLRVLEPRDAADLDGGHDLRLPAKRRQINRSQRRAGIGLDHEALAHQERVIAQRLHRVQIGARLQARSR